MFRQHTSGFLFAFLAGVSAPLLFAACGDKPPPPCVDCGGDGGAVWCFVSGVPQGICAPDETLAAITCSEGGGNWSPATVCPLEPGQTETGGQDPGAEPVDPHRDVTFDRWTGEYVINRIAFEELKLDPTPLFRDATDLRPHELGHELAAAGELSNALGWRVGDVLLDLDRYPLRDLADFSAAYTALADNPSFELTIQRGRDKIVLRYRVE